MSALQLNISAPADAGTARRASQPLLPELRGAWLLREGTLRKVSPLFQAWVDLQAPQMRSPAHPLSKLVWHRRQRRRFASALGLDVSIVVVILDKWGASA